MAQLFCAPVFRAASAAAWVFVVLCAGRCARGFTFLPLPPRVLQCVPFRGGRFVFGWLFRSAPLHADKQYILLYVFGSLYEGGGGMDKRQASCCRSVASFSAAYFFVRKHQTSVLARAIINQRMLLSRALAVAVRQRWRHRRRSFHGVAEIW